MNTDLQERNEVSDSNIFLAWFGAGAISMIILKVFIGVGQLWVTAVPVIAMLAYFLKLVKVHHVSDRPERSGDNIYYLGFLFTLVSLALALYQFGNNPLGKSSLIGDFSIALSSTILGVLGRVWLNQSEKEIDDYEKEAKIHINDAIDNLKGDLERSRETMSEFATLTAQVLSENREEQKKQLELDRKQFEEHFEKSLGQMAGIMAGAVTEGAEGLQTELENLTTSTAQQIAIFTNTIQDMNSQSGRLSAVLSESVDGFKKLPNVGEIVDGKIDDVIQPLKAANSEIKKVADQQIKWAENVDINSTLMHDAIELFISDTNDLHGSTKDMTTSLKSSASELNGQFKQTQALLADISHSLSSLQSASNSLNTLPNQVEKPVSDIHKQFTEVEGVLRQFSVGINAINADTEAALKIHRAYMEEESMGFEKTLSTRNQLTTSLAECNAQIVESVSSLQFRVEEMSKALLGIANYIRDQTKESG